MNKQQYGFTLVEMIISLLLGLALTAGIGELFIYSQKSYKTQRSLSIMMEDGSYILSVLSKELRQAGFLRNKKATGGSAIEVFHEDFNTLGSNETNSAIDLDREEFIHGRQMYSRGVSYDVFAFRYQLRDENDLAAGDAGSSPCTQNLKLDAGEDPSTTTHVVSIYFYVSPDDFGIPTLYCRAKRETINLANIPPATCAKPEDDCLSPTGVPLISNVERLVVKYGIAEGPNDTPKDPTDDVYYYSNANQVTDWRQVISAKVFVVMRSEEDNLMRTPMVYRLEESEFMPIDKRFYRVFSTTVFLRNLVE